MVAQLAGNRLGHRLRQGVAGTFLLPGHAVYTMPESLSLCLCNSLVPREVHSPKSLLSASKRGTPGRQGIAFGPKHDSIHVGLSFRSVDCLPTSRLLQALSQELS
jgi:hypothetical protein